MTDQKTSRMKRGSISISTASKTLEVAEGLVGTTTVRAVKHPKGGASDGARQNGGGDGAHDSGRAHQVRALWRSLRGAEKVGGGIMLRAPPSLQFFPLSLSLISLLQDFNQGL